MNTRKLDGALFRRMLIGGAKNLKSNSKIINDLNVFPVPDGDTGSNMSRTFETGLEEIKKVNTNSMSDIVNALSHGALLGARGNSGVILSQFLKGLQKGFQSYESVTALDLIDVYKKGSEQAYHAVVNPVEGTILTVFKESVNYTENRISEDSTIEDFYKELLEGAKEILPKTKEMLPALKEADVIDSGGQGYLCIVEGMYNALLNPDYNPVIEDDDVEETSVQTVDISAFTRDSELEFGYCTECLLRLQTKKVDPDNFDIQIIIDYLNSMGGDSIVCYKEGDVVKLHVHTPNPGNVLNELRKYGEFLTIKIENMALQHQEILNKKEEKVVREHKKLAVVAVASGNGIIDLFKELGADEIVNGGQTGNPPASAFIEAFEKIDADYIAVLPNNSNIMLTAKQAAELYKKADVRVIPAKTIQQGYSALAVLNPFFDDIQDLENDVQETIDNVVSLDVALAVKDAEINGKKVTKGDYLGLQGDNILCADKDKIITLVNLLKSVDNIKDKELITVFCGQDITGEEKSKIEEFINSSYPDLELSVFDGNQDVYSLYVSLE